MFFQLTSVRVILGHFQSQLWENIYERCKQHDLASLPVFNVLSKLVVIAEQIGILARYSYSSSLLKLYKICIYCLLTVCDLATVVDL